MNARLKQASQSSDEFSSSQKVLMDISQRTGTAFSDNAALFARSAASMREYGYSADDVLKVTEAISTGLKISGASTAEAGSVITQFSQALAQGVLRGEEFNSVNESGDRIVRALAAGMGVARKDLKAMADDGKLTADKVVPALISQLGVLRDEYAAMPETVSDGITKVENAFMAWVGGANEASGATKTLSGVLNGVAGNIDNVATAAGALVAVGGIGDVSDESDDKTEAPTPHRLEKAREEGQIPRSRELTSLLILLVGVSVIWFGGVSLARRLSGMLSAGLHFDHSIIKDPNLILGQIILLIREAMLALLPLISGVVLVALISPVMLGGLVFSGKSLQPKFSKLNPLPGIKRMFSAQTGAELLKAILKTILVGSVTGFFLWHHWPQMMRLMAESPITAMGNAMDLVGLCALLVVLGVIPMVGFDVFFQIFSHLKKLRMSRQDIRDEFKQSEGDPHVKGRIRQMQRAAARRRMMADVPKADVIVNNPTHYSVALQYDENKMSAPKVVAKGAGLVALRIREENYFKFPLVRPE